MNKNEFALCNSMFKYFSKFPPLQKSVEEVVGAFFTFMNEKRKCLFLAEMEVMFFSLPITFYYTLLYTTGKGVHHNKK